MREEQEDFEINLREISSVLMRKAGVILAVMVLCGVGTWLVSRYLIEPKYSSTSKIYVMSKTDSTISISDLNLSTGLTSDYIELIESRPVMEQVIEELKLSMGYEDLLRCITIKNPSDTRILAITATYTDPEIAKEMANTVVTVAKKQISEIMKTTEPNVVETAIATGKKVSPSNTRNALIAVILGFIASSGVILLLYILDDTVTTADDVERYLGLTTLALIPDDLDGVTGKNKKSTLKSIFKRKEE